MLFVGYTTTVAVHLREGREISVHRRKLSTLPNRPVTRGVKPS